MAARNTPNSSPQEVYLPRLFDKPVEDQVVFSGNLTAHFEEILARVSQRTERALLVDGLWEIPQLVGFDSANKVVVLVTRITGNEELGEGEFLISSLDQKWITHISSYDLEEEFFENCISIIQANLPGMRWESFLYDDSGVYEGQLVVENMEHLPFELPIIVSRQFSGK